MKIQIILLFLIFFLNSCIDRNDYIRDVYVNIEIPLNQPEFSELNAYRKFNFLFLGVKGIIIYHNNVNNYKAF